MTADPRSRPLSEVVARMPLGTTPEDFARRLEPALAVTADLSREAGGARRGFDPATERPYDVVHVTSLAMSLSARSASLFKTVSLAVAVLLAGRFYRTIEPVLVAGRLQTEQELQSGDPLIVVSDRVARAYWPEVSGDHVEQARRQPAFEDPQYEPWQWARHLRR